jgi:hypothetical protein
MRYSKIDPDFAARRQIKPSEPAPAPAAPSKPPRKPAGEFLREHLGTLTLKDLMYLGGLALTALTWAQSRASREDVEAAKKQCVDTAASAIASALAPLPPRVKALEKRAARDDQRWDRLDAWHGRVFGTPNRTPPPKFGPTAEKRGEVRYEEEDE